jgi:hypothetical protein
MLHLFAAADENARHVTYKWFDFTADAAAVLAKRSLLWRTSRGLIDVTCQPGTANALRVKSALGSAWALFDSRRRRHFSASVDYNRTSQLRFALDLASQL